MKILFPLVGFFLLSPLAQSCQQKESAGTAEGFAFTDFTTGSRKSFDLCWDASSAWLTAPLRARVEAKVVEQYNGRTPVTFQFLQTPCSPTPGLQVRIKTEEVSGAGSCGAGVVATAYPFLNSSQLSAGQTGARIGPGSDFIFCRSALRILEARGQAAFEKELAFVVLHELGHVLGLAHEQLRSDVEQADKACFDAHRAHIEAIRTAYQNSNIRTRNVGAYDRESIMNYCTPKRREWKTLEEVTLSVGDVSTLQTLYGGAPTPPAPRPTVPTVRTVRTGSPTATPEVTIYCNGTLLRRCLEQFGGGAACLSTNRSQRECTTQPATDRFSVRSEATKACIVARASIQEKVACVPWP